MPHFSVPTSDPALKESSIVSIEHFAEKLNRLKEIRDRLGKQNAFDVAIGAPFRPKTTTRSDAEKFVENARQLEAHGVTWIWTPLLAPSRAAFLENVAWFGEEIIAAFKEN
jgi:hypothetical protein